MEWNASPELMGKIQASIRPIDTDLALREVLAQDFPSDCADLTISGGWGYSKDRAIVFVPDNLPIPTDFVSLEYHISQKIFYEELIIFRPEGYRFSGIASNLKTQKLIEDGGRKFNQLTFSVSCWSDWHWEQLKKEWEESDFGNRTGFDHEAHAARRDSSQVRYERDIWFDITDVF
jgi:hypothetical protein